MCYWIKRFKEKRLLKKIRVLQSARLSGQVPDVKIQTEIKYLQALAQLYGKCFGSKHYPYALEMQENTHRNAAYIGAFESEHWLGQELIKHGRARLEWQNAQVIANEDNQKKLDDLFAQGYLYLEKASVHVVEALRLMGLCHIHAWGKPLDRKKGFALIVDSINREDSWDKLPEIFAKIGLNKPEFLKELIKYRTTGGQE